MRVLITSAAIAVTTIAVPAVAQDAAAERDPLVEPAQQAEPVDAHIWQQQIANDLPGMVSFRGLPAMRLGMMVAEDGSVTECRALPVEKGGAVIGQELCPLVIEHARFSPALDPDGNAIRSVFIARFGESDPVVAAHGSDYKPS